MKSRIFQCLKRRRKVGLEQYETEVLNKFPKKSCILKNFVNYCSHREIRKVDFEKVYYHPYFRESKFTTYCQTKASENKFIEKIVKTFSKPNINYKNKNCLTEEIKENASIDCKHIKNIVIAWGNWGKNPNALKNGAPTPGVGIRRRFEKYFDIPVVCEKMTSQTCPCCGGVKTVKNTEIKDVTRHHLLRCTNDCKSSWWNRNVLGSFNILTKALAMVKRIEETSKLPRDETSRVGNQSSNLDDLVLSKDTKNLVSQG